MRAPRFGSACIKAAQACLLAIAVCFSLGASDSGPRLDSLGHRLMCTCGCAQLLGECDHYGCPSRGEELALLTTNIASGQSDQQILNAFAAKYGVTVLAAPRTHGFDLVAWIAPFAVFAAALLGTILLVRRWSGISGMRSATAASSEPTALNPEEKERLERVRRETGAEEGF
ncbi:MAG TPA: cytochrome c-type biogenesis protein CcmH [Terracidiphilus sp.]|nr:cytochrome c-type biogenesis protein CcmH [Terracidiphilus sp.]